MNSNVVLEYGQKNCQAVGSLLYHSRLRRQVFFFHMGMAGPKDHATHPNGAGQAQFMVQKWAGQAQTPKRGRAGPNPKKG